MARILLVSGVGPYADFWHAFERTSPLIAATLRGGGYDVEVRDTVPGALRDVADFDLLVVNAGGGIAEEHTAPSEAFDDDLAALKGYLADDGAVLSIHTGNGAFGQLPQFRGAVGGCWGEASYHPDIGDAVFTPAPGAADHPVWEGLTTVEVFDESYAALELDPGVTPLVQHTTVGEPQIMGWAVGKRVIFDGLGHDERSYESPTRRALLLNEVAWLLRP